MPAPSARHHQLRFEQLEPRALDIGDWNNDGRVDLVVGGLDGRIHVFINQATTGAPDFHTGTVLQAGSSDLLVASGRASVAVVDHDGDDCKDLVLGNTEGQLLYYRNVGTDVAPAFASPEMLEAGGQSIDLPGTPRTRPAVCDWNQDGTPDLLVGAADGQVRLYLGIPPASTADPRSPLHVQDAAGQAVDVPLEKNTLIVGAATWCPHCRQFNAWLSDPSVQERTIEPLGGGLAWLWDAKQLRTRKRAVAKDTHALDAVLARYWQ